MIAQIRVIKKIITSFVIFLTFIVVRGSNCWCYIIVKKTKDYEKYCVPHLADYKLWKDSNDWNYEEIENDDGQTLTWYVSPDKKHKVLFDCTLDERVKQWEENTRVSHNGLNLDLDRKKNNMDPLFLPAGNMYEMWRSADEENLKDIGRILLNAKRDADERVKKRAEELNKLRNEDFEKTRFKISDIFVPRNTTSFFTTAAVFAGIGLYVNKNGRNNNLNENGTKNDKNSWLGGLCGLIYTCLAYIGSTLLSNCLTFRTPKSLYTTILADEELAKYRLDAAYKKDAVCDYYAAVYGESKHCSLFDDKRANERTISNVPLSESIKKHGVVVTMPKNPNELWDMYGTIFVFSQAQRYKEAVRSFGEEFVKTGDISKLKLRTIEPKK